MKSSISIFVFLAFSFTCVVAQKSNDLTISSIQNLLTSESGISQSAAIKWLPKPQGLQIGQYIIPLSKEDTHLQIDCNDAGGYEVAIYLQHGTAVTQIENPKFRRAHWTIPFKSRRSCRQFILLLEELKQATFGE